MRSTTRRGLVLGFLLLSSGVVLLASEAEELRGRAKGMRQKAAALAEQGKKEDAQRLEKAAQEMLETAERTEMKAKEPNGKGRPEGERDAGHLKERLQELMAQERKLRESNASEKELAEVRQHIEGTQRKLEQHRVHARNEPHAGLPPEFHEQAKNLEIATRRIQHIRIAAENLKAAEVHDVAGALLEKAELMEREVREAKERFAAEMDRAQASRKQPGPESVERELREEIKRLRTEIKELRQQVKSR